MFTPWSRKLNLLFCAGCLLAFQLSAEPLQLPDIGAAGGGTISPIQERELGESFLRSLRQQVEIIGDPELQDYLQSLGLRLTASADPQPFEFYFFLINDDAINAFAVPGGFIGVHSGLFTAAQTESELAGVLAHETAHITQRHMARSYEEAGKLSLPTAAALLGAVLLGTQNTEAGLAAMMAVQAGSAQYQIDFTRANEKEADRIGMQILADSGIAPEGMPDFFRRLLQSSRYAGGRPPEFLSTHPVTTNRIAEAEQRVAGYSEKGVRDRVAFQLAKARLRVITAENKNRLVEEFETEPMKAGTKDGKQVRRYGQALAFAAAGETQRARSLLQELVRMDPDRIAYQSALGRLELSDGKIAKALKIFSDTLKLYPRNRTLTLDYSRALIHAGKASEAVTILDQLAKSQKTPDPATYALLAKAANKAADPAESHRAMAEYYFLNGHAKAAIEQLTLALRTKDLNFYETSRLEARLQEMRQQVGKEQRH